MRICRTWPRRSAHSLAPSGRGASGLSEQNAWKLLGPPKRKGRKHRRNLGTRNRKLQSTRLRPPGRRLPPRLGLRSQWNPNKRRTPAPWSLLKGSTKELSAATLEKRQRRKQERERKKRKRKELRAKEKAAKAENKEKPAEAPPDVACKEPRESGLIFNKVEVTEEEPASKPQRKKEKRQKVKGNLTPLTGRNYRQLLERLQARQGRLEELRDQDAGKAQELEAKMKWTNLLYKAEGVKIRDNEQLLREALKRKEKRKAQRQRRWEKRSEHVIEKMHQRQDKRRQNLRKKKAAKAERRLQKARKKGRILPQDLERAGLS
ncbi:surfeit locus protein 6 isoform X4 [Alexandromys fortis]|uniref:surfeit locus protein 6 isoform X4 n=1 Tax=Alexandromys fortis TaxID=100897 RepID=UPI00215281EF|nr:surfeit locus protein 6 isoform X4 [Microtus fortis]